MIFPQIHTLEAFREQLAKHPQSYLIYILVIPLLIALQTNWVRSFKHPAEEAALVFFWWVSFFMLVWWLSIITTKAIHIALRHWRPSVWLLWFIGPPVATFLFHDVFVWYFNVGHLLLPEGGVYTRLPDSPFTLDYLKRYLSFAPPGLIAWVLIHVLIDRVLHIPMYRYPDKDTNQSSLNNNAPQPIILAEKILPLTESTKAETIDQDKNTRLEKSIFTTKNPVFFDCLPQEKRGQLISMQAQEHYIKVTTDQGSSLISYVFSQALAELDPLQGIRTHRSYWIANTAITDLKKEGHGHIVKLHDGSSIPVSRTYIREVRELIKQSHTR